MTFEDHRASCVLVKHSRVFWKHEDDVRVRKSSGLTQQYFLTRLCSDNVKTDVIWGQKKVLDVDG